VSNIPLLWMCFEFIYLLHVVIINLLITDKMASSSQFMHEIVFRRPGLRHFINPLPINNFEQVDVASLPGILLSNNFCFDAHVGNSGEAMGFAVGGGGGVVAGARGAKSPEAEEF